MHLFMNAAAASSGGGLTYLRNVIPHLAGRDGLKATIRAGADVRSELGNLPGISWVEAETGGSAALRFRHEQRTLPGLVRRSGCDLLVSAGNVALFRSPVPQILLARNALYTSRDFYADAWRRRDLHMWLTTRIRAWIAKRSVRHAGLVITPSEAFAEELRAWAGRRSSRIASIAHGFDPARFFAERTPLPEAVRRQLVPDSGVLRLLFVSHYNYFRNFETLLRALPLIKKRIPGKNDPAGAHLQAEPFPRLGAL